MRLGVFLTYSTAVEVALEAERLGYDLAVAPEGFRSDAVSVLGAVAARTSRIGLATGVAQLAARTPVLTALSAATLDAISGGRFRLGLGVSNRDVSEGWYGVRFSEPLRRTREYVEIVRTALRGEPVRYQGRHFQLPPDHRPAAQLHTPGARPEIPVYLAAVRPASLRLAGEIADGWVGVFVSPRRLAESLEHIRAGQTAGQRDPARFEVLPSVPIGVADDVDRGADVVRGYFAHFLAMGDPAANGYARLFSELGYGTAVRRVHELYRQGDRRGAAAAVPVELIDDVSLIGPVERIARRMSEYRDAGVTVLGVSILAATPAEQLETVRAAARAWELSAAIGSTTVRPQLNHVASG